LHQGDELLLHALCHRVADERSQQRSFLIKSSLRLQKFIIDGTWLRFKSVLSDSCHASVALLETSTAIWQNVVITHKQHHYLRIIWM
jgi:hypothetical protein